MKKGTLIEIILANIGGLFFAIGLCLLCISDWNLFSFGIVLTLIGIFNLVAIIPLYKNEVEKSIYKICCIYHSLNYRLWNYTNNIKAKHNIGHCNMGGRLNYKCALIPHIPVL